MSIKGFSVGGNVERYDYNFLDNLPSEITIDTALSDSSTNPVQNRVVTSAINSANGSISSLSGEVDDLKSAINDLANGLGTKAPVIINTASGAIASFEDGADGMPLKTLTVNVEPVQAGSGDPSPTNVRPISGWTGATVTRTGKNLLPTQEIVKIGSTFYVGGSDDWFFFKAGTYTASNIGSAAYMYWRKKGTTLNNVIHGNTKTNGTFTLTEDCEIRFWFYTNVADASFTDIQIASGSTESAYSPYSGTTIPISWETEAGTVYGGTLDVTTGVLTVDRSQIASYAGETLPGKWISDRDVYAAGTSPTTGAQVVYELATPVTYHLTPQEITTLLGQNNIWADTGDMSVTYQADTKLYIQNLTKPTEDDMTANARIESGKYFMVGNTLYLSTALILAGETINPGTNCTKSNLAEALNALNS